MAETGRKKRLPELGRRGFLSKAREAKEGSPLKQSPGGSPKRPNSPEPNCSICLGGIEDQSFANKCFHSFCKTCLFEWSKVKPECPVCRQGFDSIIFNVKAMDDYEEYNIPRPISPRSLWSVDAFITDGRWAESREISSFNILRHRVIHLQDMFERSRTREQTSRGPRRLSLIYSSDLFNNTNSSTATNSINVTNNSNTERTPPRAHESSRNSAFPFDFTSYLRSLDSVHRRPPTAGTCDHRRYIYDNDLWVQPITGRLARECSATFYRNNPAVTHRLLPFLNRELVAILRTDSDSSHAAEALYSHYNVHAIYVPKSHVKQLKLEQPPFRPLLVFGQQEPEAGDSTDDSVIEVVDSEQEQSSRRDKNRMQYLASSSSSSSSSITVATNTNTANPSVTQATSETTNPGYDEKETRKANKQVQKVSKEMVSHANQETPLTSNLSQNINVIEDFDNPRPGPSGLCRNNDFKTSNPKLKVDDDGSDTEIDVGTNEKPLGKQRYDSDSCDSDDSIKVVGFKKPIRERTPEIINISSCDSEGSENEKEKANKKKQKKRRRTKSSHSKRRKDSSCSSRPVDIEGNTTVTDSSSSSSEDESPEFGRRGHESYKFLRRIPSVIVRPPTLKHINSANQLRFAQTNNPNCFHRKFDESSDPESNDDDANNEGFKDLLKAFV
ncbi:E3 ubiquitin-protein ligase Topors-like [Panonychus citri]|uniref:E3 ubiquitin-protein ligase Topors-like n=1 Tax=Panonychus citri TaxID=50023 RepID=UPI002307BD32|nr:E3 ubiquitin-protein ligase Topors-like [Panonychus citri]